MLRDVLFNSSGFAAYLEVDGDMTSLAAILVTSWNGAWCLCCHSDTPTHNSSLIVEVGISFNVFIDPTDQFGI